MMNEKAMEIMNSNLLTISIVKYGSQKGKMKIEPNGVKGKKLFAEMSAGKYKEELMQIKAYLVEKEAEKEAKRAKRQSKIDAIDGIEEIRNAMKEMAEYRKNFSAAMDVGDGFLPACPKIDIEKLTAKYPRATAYLKAEAWSLAENFRKASIGKEAMEEIIDGGDPKSIIDKMESKWAEFAKNNIWD